MKARLPIPAKQKVLIREEVRRELDRQEQQKTKWQRLLLTVAWLEGGEK